jgi:hypothetical protein
MVLWLVEFLARLVKENKMADFDFANLGSMFGGGMGGTRSGLDALLTEDQRKLMGRNATLSAAAALLQASGRGPQRIGLGQALGSALQAGQQGYERTRAGSLQDLLLGEKLKEGQAERARDVDYFAMLKAAGQPAQPMPAGGQMPMPPDVIDGPGVQVFAPDAPRAAAPAAASNIFSNLTQEQRTLLAGMPRKEGAKFLLETTKPEATPENIRTLRALGLPVTLEGLRQLDKPEASPAESRLLREAGVPVTLENIMKLKRSGAANTNVDVRMPGNQQFLAGVGTDVSKTLTDLTAGARSANETLTNIDRMLPALDKAIVGPGADYRTAMVRIGQQLNIAGADANEQLANTRTVVQGLAQQELDAAAQMRGQGGLTEGERGILRRAAAGDQTLSAAEIKQALSTAQKTAKYRLAAQEDYVQRASKLPGFEQFAPMYQVTPYGGGGGGGGGNPLLDAVNRQLQLRSSGGPR